jgi:hypothetical protein
MYHQCQARGYAAPVDVLMNIGVLPKQKYEKWRFGRIPYLEAVCTVNLRKLSFIMHQMRVYAKKSGLNPSFCYYKKWGVKKEGGQGQKPVIPCGSARAATRNRKMVREYFVDVKKTAELKALKQDLTKETVEGVTD